LILGLERFLILKQTACDYLGKIEGSDYNLVHAVQVDSLQTVVTDSSEPVAYALTNPQSVDELACDMEMYVMCLPFRVYARAAGGFDRRQDADGWICNMLALYADLNTRLSEMQYFARSVVRGLPMAAGEDVRRFVAEGIARRRLAHIARRK
jgi:hypothetical protein